MDMTEDDWKAKLTPEQYAILREKGTEAPFTGEYVDNHKDGMYACAACGATLFTSKNKFDSGSGWPSFYDIAEQGAVDLHDDSTLGMQRTEVVCKNCGGHLGHLFDDAHYQPTGQRYCINSVCLKFEEEPKN